MDKKIASEVAIGVILLLAIMVGGIFWLYEKKQTANEKYTEQPAKIMKNADKISKENPNEECQSHFYEGESKLRGWLVKADQDENGGIIVRIKDEDVQKLPAKNNKIALAATVRLIDPTDVIKNSLGRATEEKPVEFTIKGYAEICQKQPPQVSLQQATIAFKKS